MQVKSRPYSPRTSPASKRGNPSTVQVNSNPYSPLTSPAFARGNSNPRQVKSGAFYPTSVLNIGGTKDKLTQQIEEKIRSQVCTPMKYNGSSPQCGQYGVGTSQTNQVEGASRSTFKQNRPITSFGLSSQLGNDWSIVRARTYLRDTPQIQKRKGASNDDRSLYQKSFVPASQPKFTRTERNLFKDRQMAAFHMKSTDMSKLGSSTNTKSSTARKKTYTRDNKGKSALIKSERNCEVNIYEKGKNIQAVIKNGISFGEMEKHYVKGIIDYDSIIEKSLNLTEKEWIFSPSFSYVPDPPKLVPVALSNSMNHNDFVSINNEFPKLSWEKNLNANIFNSKQLPDSVQKDGDNANLVDKIMRAVFGRKNCENSNSKKTTVNGRKSKYGKSSSGGFHQGLMGNGTSGKSPSKAILNEEAIFANERTGGGGGLLYTWNLGEVEFGSEWKY